MNVIVDFDEMPHNNRLKKTAHLSATSMTWWSER